MPGIHYYFSGFILTFLISYSSFATHIRAGEILVERISLIDPVYSIHLIIYSDRTSNVLPGGGTLYFGDGSTISNLLNESKVTIENLDNQIAKNTYTVIHQYSKNNKQYTIGYTEFNRNGGIINMSNSINTPFYTETTFVIDAPCEINNTPVLLIPPIHFAVSGKTFVHNPGAYDKEGDSLSYKLVIPKQSADMEVVGYFFPANIRLDSLSGEIQWPVPYLTGQYNIAFEIDEWRHVADSIVFLSRTVRDMQIIVADNLGKPPEIIIPPDTCLEAGDFISETIVGSDPDGDMVKIESFSKVFLFGKSPALMIPDSIYYGKVPVNRDFSWQTDETHVSSQPYKIHFKATNWTPGNFPQVDIKTWRIKVSAPAPHHMTAKLLNVGHIDLTWDPYVYGAEKIQIGRRIVGYDIPAGPCITGIPFYSRYESISETDGTSVEFIDVHPTGRFARGANYCYRLLAKIPGCTETESAPSKEVCIQIPADAPVITNVSVLETDRSAGKMYIRWTSSFDIDTTLHDPSHFTYKLQRAEGFNGKENAIIITPDHFTDTVFRDTGINTQEKIFNYTVYLYENNMLIDSSATASMVKLTSDPVLDKIGLQWQAEVPWSNNTQQYPFHFIYRNNALENDPHILSLIDSVNVNYDGFHYVDSAQFNNISKNGESCYYIITKGSYGNPRIMEPLLNYSQVYCAFKEDTIPPCMPSLVIKNADKQDCYQFLADKPCDFNNFFNELLIKPACDDPDITGFNIYFASGQDKPFTFLTFSTDQTFRHDSLPSFIGCYKATAIDFSGNESDSSPIVCNDNCPYIELPNVFTPNADGYNDFYTEFGSEQNLTEISKCPRFVNEVKFIIYNRWSKEVFRYSPPDMRDYLIQWNGLDNTGKKVVSGVYFYEAKVKFNVLRPKDQFRFYRGWLQVLY